MCVKTCSRSCFVGYTSHTLLYYWLTANCGKIPESEAFLSDHTIKLEQSFCHGEITENLNTILY